MSDAPMTEAQKRAAARKAKILARGNSGLQRLAQTARGEEADKLYGEAATASSSPSSAAPSRPEAPSNSSSQPKPQAKAAFASASSSSKDKAPGWAPPADARTPSSGTPGLGPNAPTAEDMQAQMDAMMRMLGGGAGGSGSEGAPDMNNFFAQLMGGMPPGAGPNLLGDGSDAGAAFDPNANPFANMAGMQGMGAGFPGMAGMPGMPGFAPPQPPSKAARFLPLIHAIAVIALVVFVAAWWEPTLALVRWGSKATLGSWATRWSSLAGRTGSYGVKNVEGMPVFYAFLTLEAVLFATRVTLVQTPPSLHPLLANVLPMLPPNISRLVTTGSKYLGVASQVYADGCLFVFGLGCAIVLAEYLAK